MRVLLPVLGIGLVCFAAAVLFLFKQGLDDYMFAKSLKSVEIVPPAGWDMTPYQTAHGEAIAVATFDPAPAAATTTNDILFAFESARLDDIDGYAVTFSKGDEKMSLRMQHASFVPRRTTFAERLGYAVEEPETAPEGAVFGSMDAVPFTIAPRLSMTVGSDVPVPVNYRYVTATVGDPAVEATVDIAILTNSSDAALAQLIGGLDMDAINARLPRKTDTVLAGIGFVPRQAGALSTTPPRPTSAYRAMVMLKEGRDMDAINRKIVAKIANAEITDMAGLVQNYPDLDAIRFDVLALLENGSHENSARYYARVMANSGRAWNNHEYYLLSQIAKLGTSQESLADYLANGHDIAPEVLALVARLPEASAVETGAETSGPVATPTVARGGFSAQICSLQNGVRRCVVGGD